jgi:succinate dehydrogenase / fumarate reductase flavoprotein subunit
MASLVKQQAFQQIPAHPEEAIRAKVSRILGNPPTNRAEALRTRLQKEMMDKCSVNRTGPALAEMKTIVEGLRRDYEKVGVVDHGERFNSDLLEALELEFLLDNAEVTVAGALARTESRGAHFREDFPKRDDAQWLKHTLAYRRDNGVELRYKPVTITKLQPQERKY